MNARRTRGVVTALLGPQQRSQAFAVSGDIRMVFPVGGDVDRQGALEGVAGGQRMAQGAQRFALVMQDGRDRGPGCGANRA